MSDQNNLNSVITDKIKEQQIKRDRRDELVMKKCENKKFIDISECNLDIPETTGNLNLRQLKRVEQQIAAFFMAKGQFTVPHCYLDGYVGYLCGKYPILYQVKYHGWLSLKKSVQELLRYERETFTIKQTDLR